jgi:hypothetical protein
MLPARAPSNWPLSVACVTLFAFILAALLPLSPCPPWSLKSIVAQRAQCISNLKQILKSLDDQKVPLDENDVDEIRRVLQGLNLECPEGTQLRGRPATYSLQTRNSAFVLSEERGNHPARARLMAGSRAEEQFTIDGTGNLTRVP